MDSELGSNIEKIGRLLENKDLMQSLGPLLSALTGKSGDTVPGTAPPTVPGTVGDVGDIGADLEFSSDLEDDSVSDTRVDLSTSAVPVTRADPRIDLLNSLKPFCCQERQRRVNLCIQIMGLLKVTNLFRNDFQK